MVVWHISTESTPTVVPIETGSLRHHTTITCKELLHKNVNPPLLVFSVNTRLVTATAKDLGISKTNGSGFKPVLKEVRREQMAS